MKQKYLRIVIVVLVILIIFLVSNIFITREGFYTNELSNNISINQDFITPNTIEEFSILEPYECSYDEEPSDDDCYNIRTIQGDEKKVRNVCPKDPRCLGICIDDHTWTEKNKRDLGAFDSNLNVVGKLRHPDMKHLISSSRCLECIKNFGTAANLLRESNSCIID